MNKQREALKMALEAMEDHAKQYPHMQKGYTLDAIEALREALTELEKTEPILLCWDETDPEYCGADPQNMAEIFADNMWDDESKTFKVMVAVPLPNRIMRVKLSGGNDREMTWEWVNE